MNSITVKVLGVALSVFIMIMVGSQIAFMINNSHDTEEAVLYTVNENITFKGMFLRDERVINYDNISGGVINYLYDDGLKVSENSAVARVYSNEDQIYYRNRLSRLKTVLSDLKRAQSPGTTNYVQAEALRNKIKNDYLNVANRIQQKDYSSVCSNSDDLLYTMNIYNIVTGTEENFKPAIKQIKSEINDLNSKVEDPIDSIMVNSAGYFVKSVDGYESTVSYEDIENMSTDELQKLFDIKPKVTENTVGKLLKSYEWKFLGIIKNTNKFLINDDLSIRFNSSNKVYDVTVDSIKPIDGTDNSIVILSCNELDENVLNNRFDNAELIFDEYTGVKIPREAIRFQGEQKGVYVMLGQQITFKKIDVIYEGDDYVLSKNTSDDSYLLLYDQILLEGVSADEVSSGTATDSNTE